MALRNMSRRKKKKTQPKREALPAPDSTPPSREIDDQAQSPKPKARTSLALWLAGVCAVALLFMAFKMFSMNAYAGDEHIYLYQAKLISEGVAPYSGFAMAHPPVHAIFTAIIFKLFGYHFLLGRFLPVLWCLAGGIVLAVLVRRELGATASIAAMALFLLAYEPLRASSHYTGINMTVALLISAVLAFRLNAVRTCAALSVLAVFTRLYAAPGVMVLVAFALIDDRRRGLKLILWGGALGAFCFIAFGIWSGFGDMIHNMVLYHAQKTPMQEGSLASMRDKVLFHNSSISALFVLAQFALISTLARSFGETDQKLTPIRRMLQAVRSSRTGLIILGDGIALFFLFVLLSMDRVWMYYFIPSFPFAAISAGWLISRWLGAAFRLVRARGKIISMISTDRAAFFGGAVLFALFAVAYLSGPLLETKLDYYEKEIKKPKEDRTHAYTWQSGILPDSVAEIMRFFFWKDVRVIGEPYTCFNYYLWHESRILDIVDETVATIAKETTRSGEIFGDSGTVPLFALLSGRRIAGNEVDTNIQRYRSGNANPKELIDTIDSPKTEMIILRHRFGVTALADLQQLIKEKYRILKGLRTSEGTVFYLYKRK
jgi:hypothetical protein